MNSRNSHKLSYVELRKLPNNVVDSFLVYLSNRDLDSLSQTCYFFLDRIGKARELAPTLRFTRTNPVPRFGQAEYKEDVRYVLPDLPGAGLDLGSALGDLDVHQKLPEHRPPTYTEATGTSPEQRPVYSKTFWRHRMEKEIWLCPHVSLTQKEMLDLSRERRFSTLRCATIDPVTYRMSPARYEPLDAFLEVCPFPKCALWVRHALNAVVVPNKANISDPSETDDVILELVSCVKVCTFRSRQYETCHETLCDRTNLKRLCRALTELELFLCAHVTTRHVVKSWRSLENIGEQIPVLNGHDMPVQSDYDKIHNNHGQITCAKCERRGSYTVGRLIARYASGWLHVELLLRRPLFSEWCFPTPGHCKMQKRWDNHAVERVRLSLARCNWWSWAAIVSEGGFVWRAKLPATILRKQDTTDFEVVDQEERYRNSRLSRIRRRLLALINDRRRNAS